MDWLSGPAGALETPPRLDSTPAASTTSAGQNPWRADTVRCAAVGSKPSGTNIAPRSRRMPDRWWRLLRPRARENNRSASPRTPEYGSFPRRPHDVCHRSPLHRVRSPASRQCARHAAYNARVSTRAADSRVRSRTKACNLSAARGITTINAPARPILDAPIAASPIRWTVARLVPSTHRPPSAFARSSLRPHAERGRASRRLYWFASPRPTAAAGTTPPARMRWP